MLSKHARDQALSATRLDHGWIFTLQQRGLMTVGQLADAFNARPKGLAKLLSTSQSKLAAAFDASIPNWRRICSRQANCNPMPLPPLGIASHIDQHDDIRKLRKKRKPKFKTMFNRHTPVKDTQDAPTRVDLHRYVGEVENQGAHGWCVGYGTSACRSLLAQTQQSAPFAYFGAKRLDGHPDIEGSWQYFAMQFAHQFGSVDRWTYTYEDAEREVEISKYYELASQRTIDLFVDMLPADNDDYSMVPQLMKWVLSGTLNSALGPRNIAVSLMLYESFATASAARTGMITLPLPDERCIGGHAMNVVGYLDASDPNALYGIDWFIVRNSWGTKWAPENPLGLPGHALIPAAYFQSSSFLGELYLQIAEPSPVNGFRSAWHRIKAAAGAI